MRSCCAFYSFKTSINESIQDPIHVILTWMVYLFKIYTWHLFLANYLPLKEKAIDEFENQVKETLTAWLTQRGRVHLFLLQYLLRTSLSWISTEFPTTLPTGLVMPRRRWVALVGLIAFDTCLVLIPRLLTTSSPSTTTPVDGESVQRPCHPPRHLMNPGASFVWWSLRTTSRLGKYLTSFLWCNRWLWLQCIDPILSSGTNKTLQRTRLL